MREHFKSTFSTEMPKTAVWHAPAIRRIALTRAEVDRITNAEDPSAELRRAYLTKSC
jgi:hypothetical protein